MNDLAQEFLRTIAEYDHFSRNAMDVELHAEWLAICFRLDHVCPEPTAGDISRLIADLVDDIATPLGLPPLLKTIFAPGVAYDERTHPGGRITLLPAGTAVMIFDQYVVRLGELAGRPLPPGVPQAGYWIDPGWTFVGTFMDRFYVCVADLMHKVDREERQRVGYSRFEILRLKGLRSDVDVEELLIERVERVRELDREMQEALEKRANIEAVGRQAELFHRLLGDALEIHGRQVPDGLMDIINAAAKLSHQSELAAQNGLWARLHDWRKQRNAVIHPPRESMFSQPERVDTVNARARATAQEGATLVAEVQAWSIEARARSLDMSLPRPARATPTH